MTRDLPEFYFRARDNGAAVYRVDTENRERRLDLVQIAVAHVKKGEIRAHGAHELTEDETRAIEAWIDKRRAQLATRAIDDILRTVDHLNATAQWAQASATDDDLDQVTDTLLLAMHDLRTVLVRKKSDRLKS